MIAQALGSAALTEGHEPSPRLRRDRLLLTGVAVLCVAMLSLAWTGVASPQALVLATLAAIALPMARWWCLRPAALWASASVVYALLQDRLEDLAVPVAGATLNGSQLFLVTVAALLTLRVAPLLCPRPGVVRIPPVLVPLLVLIASAGIGLWRSPHPEVATATFVRMAISVVPLLVGYLTTRARPSALETYRSAVEVVALTVACGGVASLLLAPGDAFVYGDELRTRGTFGSPIQVAAVAMIGVPAFVAHLLERRGAARSVAAVVGLGALGLGLFSAFTRRALMACGVFLLSLVLLPSAQGRFGLSRRRRVMVTVVASLAMLLGLGIVDAGTLSGRLDDLPILGDVGWTDPLAGSGRNRIWSAMLAELARNEPLDWIVGHGLNASYTATALQLGAAKAAHSTYLELLYGQGVIGLGAYLWFLATAVVGLRRTAAMSGPAGTLAEMWWRLLLVFALSVDLFGSSIYQIDVRWYVYAVAGSLLAVGRHAPIQGSINASRA